MKTATDERRGKTVGRQGEDVEATQSGKCDDNPAYELHWTTSGGAKYVLCMRICRI